MNISRRHLTGPLTVLGLVAVSLPGARAAQEPTADEEAVAKRLEAFRSAQFAADAKALRRALRAGTELQPLRRPRRGQGDVHQERHQRKIEVRVLEYKDPWIRVVGDAAIVRFHWMAESELIPDGKKSATDLHILMNWQKQGADWKLLSRASTKL